MSPNNNLGLSLSTYQDFGINANQTTLFRNWLTLINNKSRKSPVGIIFKYNAPTAIEGYFVYKGTHITNYIPLKWYGKKKASLTFVLPSFFKDFIKSLPVNERTKTKKHPKVYCKIKLSADFSSIIWSIDQTMNLHNFISYEAFKSNFEMYQKIVNKRFEKAIKMISDEDK